MHSHHPCLHFVLSCCSRCPSHCVSPFIFSFCSVGHQMLQGATMQQLQQVQVQSQGTPITVNTHALYMCNCHMCRGCLENSNPKRLSCCLTEACRGECRLRSDDLYRILLQTQVKDSTYYLGCQRILQHIFHFFN